jgi:hypothetical protein
MQLLEKKPFFLPCGISLASQPVTNGEGEASGANFESEGAKPAPPGSPSRNKSAAAFRKAPLLPGRRGYEFYCQRQASGKKKPPP